MDVKAAGNIIVVIIQENINFHRQNVIYNYFEVNKKAMYLTLTLVLHGNHQVLYYFGATSSSSGTTLTV